MRFRTRVLRDPRNRRFAIVAVLLAVLSVVLAPVHTASALLAVPLAASIAYVVCDVASHALTGRRLVAPSKYGWNSPMERRMMRWSDHVLALLVAILAVLGLFIAGEVVDCIRKEDAWHGEPIVPNWCSEDARNSLRPDRAAPASSVNALDQEDS